MLAKFKARHSHRAMTFRFLSLTTGNQMMLSVPLASLRSPGQPLDRKVRRPPSSAS